MTVLPLNVMPFWRRQLRVPQGSTLVLLADIFINHKSYRVQLEPRNQLFLSPSIFSQFQQVHVVHHFHNTQQIQVVPKVTSHFLFTVSFQSSFGQT